MKQKIQNIKILSVFIILMLIMISSCKESFLEPKPLSFFAPENVLIDENGLQALLDNALETMRYEMCTDQNPFNFNSKYSDVAVDGSTNKSTPWQDLNNQMLPDGQYFHNAYTKIGWYWDGTYKVIKDCNTIISRIDDVEFSSEIRKNVLLGGAYFLRAYRYFMKTLQWGDVPLILEEIKEPRVDFYSTTKESIWQKMIKDLEFSVQHVPEANQVDKGQVTKAACKQLLAKYYLLEGRFDDAIKQTSDIINGGVHRLTIDRFGVDKDIVEKDVIWDLHRAENKSRPENTEGLWLTINRYGMEGNTAGVKSMRNVVPNYAASGVIKTPDGANAMSDKSGLEIGLIEKYGRGVARVSPSNYSEREIWIMNGEMDWQDGRHNRDNGNWVTMEDLIYNDPALKKSGNEWYGKNVIMYLDDGTSLCSDSIMCAYQWPHYKVWIEDPDADQPAGGPGDWYIYRIAETYLLRAEAYVWKGEWQKAADDINIIRQRANAQYMYTASDLQKQGIDAVLDERNRELFFEEARKVELTRMAITFARTGIPCYNGKTYNMENLITDNFYYDRVNDVSNYYNKNVPTAYGNYFTISPFHIFWPIPSYAIEANVGGVINQNEGYPGVGGNVPPLVYEGD